jgi:hypothetical protein
VLQNTFFFLLFEAANENVFADLNETHISISCGEHLRKTSRPNLLKFNISGSEAVE